MSILAEFVNQIRKLDENRLIQGLEIDRELLSEAEETDPIKFRLEERVRLYRAELQVRKYFKDAAITLSSELTVLEIKIGVYISLLKENKELTNFSETGILYDAIIKSMQHSDKEETILCAVKGSHVIIDIKTLMSDDNTFKYDKLAILDGFKPDYNHISELPHLFWNYILSESGVFSLVREVGAAFLKFFNEPKIYKSIMKGLIYNRWDEKESLNTYIQSIESSKEFIDFSILIQIYNHTDLMTKWYVLEINRQSIVIHNRNVELMDAPLLKVDVFKDYNSILETETLSRQGIEEIKKSFVDAFSSPILNEDYEIDMSKDFIHVLEFKFDVLDCRPEYSEYK